VAKVSTSGNDVIFTVGNGSITIKDAKNKIISYSDANGDKTYSTVPATPYKVSKDGKTVTIYTSYDKKDFDVTETVAGGDKIETIDASAVNYGINIIGNEKSNKIIGGSGNDTLEGDNGNDSLVGGDGSDVFLYYGGYGNDIISDYAESDIISIASGNISKVKPNGKDVIFTVGKNKITVKNALRKGITYIDKDDVEHDYKNGEQTVKINETKTTATISEDYWKKTFDVANFGKKIRIIDATPVTNDIKITGNDKANQILGGSGKNTLTGGAGNDTLQGNDKEDIFVYNKGDGDDFIVDYSEGDKISIVSGIVNNVSVKSDTVILTVGDGKITVYGAAGKTRITYRDENGEKSKIYSKETSNSNVAEPLWFAENNFTEVNQLSAIVQNNSADCSFVNTSTKFSKEDNLITYSDKKITR
jgi:Ca2+-binding RTX toxin-like protein